MFNDVLILLNSFASHVFFLPYICLWGQFDSPIRKYYTISPPEACRPADWIDGDVDSGLPRDASKCTPGLMSCHERERIPIPLEEMDCKTIQRAEGQKLRPGKCRRVHALPLSSLL